MVETMSARTEGLVAVLGGRKETRRRTQRSFGVAHSARIAPTAIGGGVAQSEPRHTTRLVDLSLFPKKDCANLLKNLFLAKKVVFEASERL